jgi:nitrate/nitrite transport system ATP-binding protein
MDPRILLLDEPLGALDALTRGTLQEEIARIWQTTRKTVLLITNDVDEAILLADRVIPLTTGPGATLGEAVPVPLSRPRDRKALNHDPEFKHLRNLIINQLLAFGARRTTTVLRKLTLPDILPEDISRGRPMLAFGSRPKRRNEEKREEVTISS